MQECWRWFGPKDPVSLADVRQAGATGVVTALHDQPNGAIWPEEEIAARKAMIEAAGLSWAVVESIPVHEDIKTGAPGWEALAENWAETARRLARQGVRTICYNFMPVLDWTRTDLTYEMPDGARALRFDFAAYAAFDLLILQRAGAEADYSEADKALAQAWFDASSQEDRAKLQATIIAGLPGSEESYSLESFRAQLARYDGIDAAGLKARLKAFLEIVVPVAKAEGFTLAIHPDDPPRPLFGLPRIVSSFTDLQDIAAMVDAPENGFTFCTGSLGVRPDNDLPAMIEALAPRIHFAHLRATKRETDPRSFHEDAHLAGDLDMMAVLSALLAAEKADGVQIPMRPDHGHQILTDLGRESTPGYPAIGRLRGLAELRGAIRGLEWSAARA
ncbi:Mannonate dehydratase [Pseudoruegeria aquimaris]|uniref:Mannonate dehydratase n=1 Tax=Pseudoruegeria aquimaris TaxID=393663 RepID=A0A1Y5TAH1_9RHOB|nr:mannonate dehydratase [Pseudoruegeria aquimaris]SLN59482.1 Mannonate dehydratase [Pseudoruegeria aquimaris]